MPSQALALMFLVIAQVERSARMRTVYYDRIVLTIPRPLYRALLNDHEVVRHYHDGLLTCGDIQIRSGDADEAQAFAHSDHGERKGEHCALEVKIDPLRELLASADIAME